MAAHPPTAPGVATPEGRPSPSAAHRYDVFLSHRYKDRDAVAALARHVEEELGYTVYVDWKSDPGLDRTRVNRETAERFRQVMRYCNCLLFYARPGVGASRWMPWELGFFDGRHGERCIAVFADEPEAFKAGPQEYLDLYRVVGRDELPAFLADATLDTAAMTSATYDQWMRHVDKLASDPLDYGLSVLQWCCGAGANQMLDPARLRAEGDEQPTGPLRPGWEALRLWYGLLRQQQTAFGVLRQQAQAARPKARSGPPLAASPGAAGAGAAGAAAWPGVAGIPGVADITPLLETWAGLLKGGSDTSHPQAVVTAAVPRRGLA